MNRCNGVKRLSNNPVFYCDSVTGLVTMLTSPSPTLPISSSGTAGRPTAMRPLSTPKTRSPPSPLPKSRLSSNTKSPIRRRITPLHRRDHQGHRSGLRLLAAHRSGQQSDHQRKRPHHPQPADPHLYKYQRLRHCGIQYCAGHQPCHRRLWQDRLHPQNGC